jgi:periplasmic divalent cation tolerance protein
MIHNEENMRPVKMEKDLEIISITITLDDRQKLEDICRVLVEKRLVACAQISGPIKSIYRWNGSLEETEEWVGIIKTRCNLYEEVEKEIVNLHPYEVPEIISGEIPYVLPSYKGWVISETNYDKSGPH